MAEQEIYDDTAYYPVSISFPVMTTDGKKLVGEDGKLSYDKIKMLDALNRFCNNLGAKGGMFSYPTFERAGSHGYETFGYGFSLPVDAYVDFKLRKIKEKYPSAIVEIDRDIIVREPVDFDPVPLKTRTDWIGVNVRVIPSRENELSSEDLQNIQDESGEPRVFQFEVIYNQDHPIADSEVIHFAKERMKEYLDKKGINQSNLKIKPILAESEPEKSFCFYYISSIDAKFDLAITNFENAAIPATISTLDGKITYQFDAEPWFQNARTTTIEAMAQHQWKECSEADEIYDFFRPREDFEAIEDHLNRHATSFKIELDPLLTEYWLEKNKPELHQKMRLKPYSLKLVDQNILSEGLSADGMGPGN